MLDQDKNIPTDADFDVDLNIPATNPGMMLGDYLLSKNLISPDKLNAALSEQSITGEKLGIILVRNGFIRKKDLITSILDTRPDHITSESIYITNIPNELFFDNKAMIVAETSTTVYIACLTDEAVTEEAFKPYFPSRTIEFVNADLDQIDAYVDSLVNKDDADYSLSDYILRRAFFENASDIHIMPKSNSYTIFYRLLGVRYIVHEGTLEEYQILTSRIKDMSRMDISERRLPQDGGFSMELNGKMVDLRVSSTPTVNGETIVIRLLDPDKVQPTLEGLGISNVDLWRTGVSRDSGLCLICGITGSGKTTTLNATVKEMDRFGMAIYTLEDPVEYRIPYVNQVNINQILNLDFSRGVKSLMRMDPDVIIVGEIRDLETAQNAIKAAETGHLVIGTLHTGTIKGAIARLKNLGVPAYELTPLIRAVLVQKLVRTVCSSCFGKGCSSCSNIGYSGRTIVSECNYFKTEEEVNRLVAGEMWWPSMLEDAILKAEDGITSEEEVKRTFGPDAYDPIFRANFKASQD